MDSDQQDTDFLRAGVVHLEQTLRAPARQSVL